MFTVWKKTNLERAQLLVLKETVAEKNPRWHFLFLLLIRLGYADFAREYELLILAEEGTAIWKDLTDFLPSRYMTQGRFIMGNYVQIETQGKG